jgi:hypothetical protein
MNMEHIIEDIIWSAWRHNNRELATLAYKLMYKFATTINCPSDWRCIGENIAKKYGGDSPFDKWVSACCLLDEF